MTQPAEAVERLRAAEFRAVGSNQTAKAIGKGRAEVVFVAKDADRRVLEGVLAAARDRGVEVVEVGSVRELGRVCGVAVGASAAALLSSAEYQRQGNEGGPPEAPKLNTSRNGGPSPLAGAGL